jgi:hypothetical protein
MENNMGELVKDKIISNVPRYEDRVADMYLKLTGLSQKGTILDDRNINKGKSFGWWKNYFESEMVDKDGRKDFGIVVSVFDSLSSGKDKIHKGKHLLSFDSSNPDYEQNKRNKEKFYELNETRIAIKNGLIGAVGENGKEVWKFLEETELSRLLLMSQAGLIKEENKNFERIDGLRGKINSEKGKHFLNYLRERIKERNFVNDDIGNSFILEIFAEECKEISKKEKDGLGELGVPKIKEEVYDEYRGGGYKLGRLGVEEFDRVVWSMLRKGEIQIWGKKATEVKFSPKIVFDDNLNKISKQWNKGWVNLRREVKGAMERICLNYYLSVGAGMTMDQYFGKAVESIVHNPGFIIGKPLGAVFLEETRDWFVKEKWSSSYREMAKNYHPDHGGDEEKFKKKEPEYKVLKEITFFD